MYIFGNQKRRNSTSVLGRYVATSSLYWIDITFIASQELRCATRGAIPRDTLAKQNYLSDPTNNKRSNAKYRKTNSCHKKMDADNKILNTLKKSGRRPGCAQDDVFLFPAYYRLKSRL
jgi:hypothetical protein